MPPETKYKMRGVEIDYEPSLARRLAPLYKPSQTAQNVIQNVWMRFSNMKTNRELTYRWFGKKRDGAYRNLIEYINTCEKRWNSDGIPRVNLEDWQASIFKPETRNKVMAILSAVAQQRPRVKFKGVEKSDYLREQILKDLYDWSEDKDDGDEMALYTMLDAIIHGTAIRYEGYEDKRKTIKELTEDSEINDVKFKEKVIVEKKILTREVKLQDFYFGNMSTRKMDEQSDCVWRKLMKMGDFKLEFAGWDNYKYVLPGGDLTDDTYFSSFVSEEIREKESDLVEVIRYYNKDADEFIVLANGVWVNPLSKDKVCPIPFSHKELPFFDVVFEPFASDFPYGKALPDKMLGEQDGINALYNMMIDQSFVSVHKPLITGDEDCLDDLDLIPGKINYIGADVQNVTELQISPPNNAHFNMLRFMHESLEQSSVDSVQAGQTGGANTATEVRQAASAAARQFLLFLQFVFHGYKRKARLRVGNILQFMTSPSEIERVLGDTGEEDFKEAFQSFKIDNTQLTGGKMGSRIIEITGKEQLEEKYAGRLKERAELEPKGIEKIYITPEYIRNFEYDIEPIPDSTIKETPEVERALELEFQQQAMALYPDKVNRDAMFDEFIRVFRKQGKDIKLQTPQMAPAGMPMQGQPGGTPMSQQVINRATGGPSQTGMGGLNLGQMK